MATEWCPIIDERWSLRNSSKVGSALPLRNETAEDERGAMIIYVWKYSVRSAGTIWLVNFVINS